ncbi:MAG TPA: hypothetical protein VH186_27720 [Chloroflexia bacterium]|nr:hypothetical protein [Chloroflexia bacterium]
MSDTVSLHASQLNLKPDTERLSLSLNESATVSISFTNTTPQVDSFVLTLSGLPESWYYLSKTTFNLFPGWSEEIQLNVQIPAEVSATLYDVVLQAISESQPEINTTAHFEVAVNLPVVEPPHTEDISSQKPVDVAADQTVADPADASAEITEAEGEAGLISESGQETAEEVNELIFEPGQIELRTDRGQLVVGEGETTQENIYLYNQFAPPSEFEVVLEGLPAEWYSLSANKAFLFPNWNETFTLKISIPSRTETQTRQTHLRVVAGPQRTICAELMLEVVVAGIQPASPAVNTDSASFTEQPSAQNAAPLPVSSAAKEASFLALASMFVETEPQNKAAAPASPVIEPAQPPEQTVAPPLPVEPVNPPPPASPASAAPEESWVQRFFKRKPTQAKPAEPLYSVDGTTVPQAVPANSDFPAPDAPVNVTAPAVPPVAPYSQPPVGYPTTAYPQQAVAYPTTAYPQQPIAYPTTPYPQQSAIPPVASYPQQPVVSPPAPYPQQTPQAEVALFNPANPPVAHPENQYQPLVAPAPPAPGRQVVTTPEVEVSLEKPFLTVVAGSSVEQAVMLQNLTPLPDTFELTVEGLPNHWCTFSEPAINLFPNWNEPVGMRVEIPASVRPNHYSGVLVVSSRNQPAVRAEIRLEIDVLAPLRVEARLQPHRAKGFKANYELILRNRSMCEGSMALQLTDSNKFCLGQFSPPAVTIPPGQSRIVPLKMQLRPKTPKDQSEQSQSFEVQVSPSWLVAGEKVTTAEFLVEGEYIPVSRWIFIARHPILCALAIMFVLIILFWSILVLPAIQNTLLFVTEKASFSGVAGKALRVEQSSFSATLQNNFNPVGAFVQTEVRFSEEQQKTQIRIKSFFISADITGTLTVDPDKGTLLFIPDKKGQENSFPWMFAPPNKVAERISGRLKPWLVSQSPPQRMDKAEIEGNTLFIRLRACRLNEPACQ